LNARLLAFTGQVVYLPVEMANDTEINFQEWEIIFTLHQFIIMV